MFLSFVLFLSHLSTADLICKEIDGIAKELALLSQLTYTHTDSGIVGPTTDRHKMQQMGMLRSARMTMHEKWDYALLISCNVKYEFLFPSSASCSFLHVAEIQGI